MRLRSLHAAVLLAFVALASPLARVADAQEKPGKRELRDLPLTHPRRCPYCYGDPILLERAGLVSHGPFEFASTTTEGSAELLPTVDLYWLETAHYEIGFALAAYRPKQAERRKWRRELEELAKVLPEVNPKAKIIDPWLRLHVYGQRLEQAWTRWLEVMRVKESDFPDGTKPWLLGEPYMGEGPYVGQKGKYEVLVLPTPDHQVAFMRDQFGLTHKLFQRWNVIDRDSLIFVTSVTGNDLRDDRALHGHLIFNNAIQMLDGYKHYSYETPVWLREGIGHFMERELDPNFNTFDFSEGAVETRTYKADWETEVKKLVLGGEAPRLAELVNLKTYAQFTVPYHFAVWSMTVFMIEEYPEGYACLNAQLHGIKDANGHPDGSNMRDRHRKAFTACLGMNYVEFDRKWREWVIAP